MFLLCFNITSSRFSLCCLSLSRKWSFHSPQVKRTKTARTFHNSTKAYHGRKITSTHTNRDMNKVHVAQQDVLLNPNLKCISVSSNSERIFQIYHKLQQKETQRNETPTSWLTSERAAVAPPSEIDLFIFKMRRSAESTEYSSLSQHGW